MFKFAVVCSLVLSSVSAFAGEYKFINSDGSALGQLCIAAVESSEKDGATLQALATELGLVAVEVDSVACNGKSLKSFAKTFSEERAAAIKTYVVNIGNQNPETQLCFAALVSADEYTKLLNTQFKNVQIEQEVMCNGLPIKQFVRKYRDRLAVGAGAKKETAAL